MVVEGYTDKTGSYLSNLNLSLQRSQRVLCTMFATSGGNLLSEDQMEGVRSLFLVGGYSFNAAKDRRGVPTSGDGPTDARFVEWATSQGGTQCAPSSRLSRSRSCCAPAAAAMMTCASRLTRRSGRCSVRRAPATAGLVEPAQDY